MFTPFQSLILIIIILIHEPKLTTSLPLRQVSENEFFKLIGATSPKVKAKLSNNGKPGVYLSTSRHGWNNSGHSSDFSRPVIDKMDSPSRPRDDKPVKYYYDGQSQLHKVMKSESESEQETPEYSGFDKKDTITIGIFR